MIQPCQRQGQGPHSITVDRSHCGRVDDGSEYSGLIWYLCIDVNIPQIERIMT